MFRGGGTTTYHVQRWLLSQVTATHTFLHSQFSRSWLLQDSGILIRYSVRSLYKPSSYLTLASFRLFARGSRRAVVHPGCSAMDTPPGGNTVDVETLARALSCLNVETKLPGSIPKSFHDRDKIREQNELPLLKKKRILQGSSLMDLHRDSHIGAQKNRLWLVSVALHWWGKMGFSGKQSDQFWKNAGVYIQSQVHSEHSRTWISRHINTVFGYASILDRASL